MYYWRGNVTNLVAENSDNDELQTTAKGVADYAMPEIGQLILTTSATFNPAKIWWYLGTTNKRRLFENSY